MNITISTKELRENFSAVLDAMASDKTITLLYRSRPLAEIKPLPQASSLMPLLTAFLYSFVVLSDLASPQGWFWKITVRC